MSWIVDDKGLMENIPVREEHSRSKRLQPGGLPPRVLHATVLALCALLFSAPTAAQKPITVGDAVLQPLAATLRGATHPAFSPDGQWIALSAQDENGFFRLWKVPARGGTPQQFSFGEGGFQDEFPQWSPDGKRIAFISNRGGETHIWTLLVAGGDPQRLSAEALNLKGYSVSPSWSPDGEYIAYNARVDDNVDIYMMPAAGGAARRITRSPTRDVFPSFSPDGKELVFASAPGTEEILRHPERFTLWTASVEGGTARRLGIVPHPSLWGRFSPDGRWLAYQTRQGSSVWADLWIVSTRGGDPIPVATLEGQGGYVPQWSPDGLRIAYTSGGVLNSNLVVVPVAGGEPTVLVEDDNFFIAPSFSPDGRRIAYTQNLIRHSESGMQILEVSLDDGHIRPLINGPGQNWAPRFSPDGNWLAFVSDRGGADNIWIAPADGGEAEPLTLGADSKHSPAWSSDGERIAFVAMKRGANISQIWTVEAAGGRPVRLTDHPSRNIHPTWLPEGIAFLSNRDWGNGQPWSILVRDLDGGAPRLFYQTEIGRVARVGGPWGLALSPDGRSLAYAVREGANTHLDLVSLGDGSRRRLDAGFHPAFSPDGRHIAYGQFQGWQTAVWIADVSRIVVGAF